MEPRGRGRGRDHHSPSTAPVIHIDLTVNVIRVFLCGDMLHGYV